MSQAKERPMLFNGPMASAVLDGRKTVTRRVVSARSLKEIGYGVQLGECHELPADGKVHPNSAGYYADLCPYGQPGDLLWGRESFWQAGEWTSSYPEGDCDKWNGSRRIHYRADGEPPNEPNRHYPRALRNGSHSAADPDRIWRARPSIHMPCWASRILLEITEVRIELLQHITIGQICKEGLARSMYEFIPVTAAFDAFAELWNSTGGDWDANPWVWAIEFKRVQP
ncbi:morphogenetic protein [Pseudomonas putida]|uniref:morphogenetic protein n=1 Tax=Pseudomonas putida TaxID=303 RepID=UPI00370CD53C